METNREKLLSFIRMNGPVLPVQVSKFLNTDIIFAGAMLSELVANKHVLITNTKRGGSPFYYVKGQESKLQNLGVYLSGKEKEAFELIKENKIINDNEALPWQRVALRAIKDFAFPIEVEFGNTKEIFWKWYTLSGEETNTIVGRFLDDISPKQEVLVKETEIEPEDIETLNLESRPNAEELNQKAILQQTEPKKEEISHKEPKPRKRTGEQKFDFKEAIFNYFNKMNISVVEEKILKQDKEIDYNVQIPSNIGRLSFYLKAKYKNTINDGDLALAYSIGQQKKLQTIFLSNGSLTKKGKEYLEKHLKGQLIFISFNDSQ